MTAELLNLSAYGFDIAVAPLAGGGIARLDWHGKPVLRPAVEGAVAARDPLGLSSFPMTPYASRIVDGAFEWGDVSTQIPPNMTGGAHPLHGIGWHTPWSVIAEDERCIEIALVHDGDTNWPWAFESRQRFNLYEDHVEVRLSVTSRDPRPFPSSLGPHPYFFSEGAEIQFDAAQLWEISGEALPSHLARPAVVDHLAEGVVATSLDLDHCFEGWNGRARIKWAEHGVEVGASVLVGDTPCPCTRLQLYTPPQAGFFCLEPVTARGVSFTAANPYELGVVELVDQTLTIITTLTPFRAG
jgi:aldose 1-epimerase